MMDETKCALCPATIKAWEELCEPCRALMKREMMEWAEEEEEAERKAERRGRVAGEEEDGAVRQRTLP